MYRENMKNTRSQLRRIILETFHQGIRPMRDVLSPEVHHDMRVIQLQNFFLAMKKHGNTNEEIVNAAREALQALYSEKDREDQEK